MNTITHRQLRELAKVDGFPCLTIYLATSHGGAQRPQDSVRLRYALRKAETLLTENGCAPSQAEELLKVPRGFIDSESFWKHPGDGLALFITARGTWTFHLPIPFADRVSVDRRFLLAPLLPAVSAITHFLVLALSENHVKLFRAAAGDLELLNVPHLPTSLKESLYRDAPEAQIHALSGARAGQRKERAVFHGQGAATGFVAKDQRNFCRTVRDAIAPVLAREGAPLVLAAVDRLGALFAAETDDPHLIPERVVGSPDHWSRDELRERSRAVLRDYQERCDADDVGRITELVGMGVAAQAPCAVLVAATRGQVNELFVARNAELRGRFDASQGQLHLAPRGSDGDDLVEYAVHETLRHDGVVRTVDPTLLTTAPIAAWLRYSAR